MPGRNHVITVVDRERRTGPVWMNSGSILRNHENGNDWKNVTDAFMKTGIMEHVIKPQPMMIEMPNGQYKKSDKLALMRSPNGDVNGDWEEMKHVTDNYNVVTPQRIGEIADQLPWGVEAVGMPRDGGKLLVSMKMKNSRLLDDERERYEHRLFIIDDYKGGSAVSVVVASLRLFCMNQVPLLLSRGKDRMSFPHIGEPDKMLELRINIEKIAMTQREKAIRMHEQLLQTQISEEQCAEVLKVVFPEKDEPEEIEDETKRSISKELADFAAEQHRTHKYAWDKYMSRIYQHHMNVMRLFEQENSDRPEYADSAGNFLNAVTGYSNWRSGRGKADRSIQVLFGTRAGEMRRAYDKVGELLKIEVR